MGEGGGERGELGVELAELLFVGVGETGAGADEVLVITVEEVTGLGVEVQRDGAAVEGIDAGEEGGVEADGVGVRGDLRRHFLFDRAERVVGVGAGEVVEDALDAGEELAGALEGDDGVFEGGGLGVAGDGFDFAQLLGHAGFERGAEVRVFDLVELRVAEWERAFAEERVVGRRRLRGQGQ